MRAGPYSPMTSQMPVPVCYPPDTLAAVVIDGGGAFLSPALDASADDDPGKVFVAAMCLFAGQVMTGGAPGPYSDERAAAWARCLLLPAGELAAFAEYPDEAIAEALCLPQQQVALRRDDGDVVALIRRRRNACARRQCTRPSLLAEAAAASAHVGGRSRR